VPVLRGLAVPLACASVLLGALLADPAPATTRVRPVCHLVTDPRGDAETLAVPHVPGTDTDDLLSADVASDGRTVTAVLRLVAMQSPDPVAPGGRGYVLTFARRGGPTTYFLAARTYLTGTRYQYGVYADDLLGRSYVKVLGLGTGTISTTRREVRVNAPVAGLLPRGTRNGTTLVELRASVYRQWGQEPMEDPDLAPVHVPMVATAVDEGVGDRYVIGTPSCVKPGP
jgi:hypothetical protein